MTNTDAGSRIVEIVGRQHPTMPDRLPSALNNHYYEDPLLEVPMDSTSSETLPLGREAVSLKRVITKADELVATGEYRRATQILRNAQRNSSDQRIEEKLNEILKVSNLKTSNTAGNNFGSSVVREIPQKAVTIAGNRTSDSFDSDDELFCETESAEYSQGNYYFDEDSGYTSEEKGTSNTCHTPISEVDPSDPVNTDTPKSLDLDNESSQLHSEPVTREHLAVDAERDSDLYPIIGSDNSDSIYAPGSTLHATELEEELFPDTDSIEDSNTGSPEPIDFREYESLDELEELDEDLNDADRDANLPSIRITREDRAKQAAILLIQKYDWQQSDLPLLQSIFVTYGWSSCRVAIEAQIEKGMTPDELSLAKELRIYWETNEKYWIALHRVNPVSPSGRASSAYKTLGWITSLQLIRYYDGVPHLDEIIELIESTYDAWYYSSKVRRRHPVFKLYLEGTTIARSGEISGVNHLHFTTEEHYHDNDLDFLGNANYPTDHYLRELGIEINQFSRRSF